jgi:hypothetical protein
MHMGHSRARVFWNQSLQCWLIDMVVVQALRGATRASLLKGQCLTHACCETKGSAHPRCIGVLHVILLQHIAVKQLAYNCSNTSTSCKPHAE